METMHPAGRRTLPPVPRVSSERTGPDSQSIAAPASDDFPTDRFTVDPDGPPTEQLELDPVGPAEAGAHEPDGADPRSAAEQDPADRARADDGSAEADGDNGSAEADGVTPDAVEQDGAELDPSQLFVARLRAAAADFAEAAGATSAVVCEAVPPARHRRSRCRVVLRYAGDREADVTFLGPAGAPGSPSRHGFDRQIRRWLGSGQPREEAWLVPDPEAPDGTAIDVSAWLASA
jgi:hypothetical protein